MNIIEILNDNLIGKEIKIWSVDFKMGKKSKVVQKRYFLSNYVALKQMALDKRLSNIKEETSKIIRLEGYEDEWEGDNIYIIIDKPYCNNLSIGVLTEIELV